MADVETAPAGSGGSILTRKTGPLPNWAWMAILLVLAVAYAMWQRAHSASTGEGPTADTSDDTLDNQTAPPVFILPQNPQPTVPVNVTVTGPAPATPPAAPPIATKPIVTQPPPKPAPPTKTPAVAYDSVTVVKYTSKNPPANSTLWGIAKSKGYGSAGDNWKTIWNDPKNAALKKKRGDPKHIQPGDVVYVRRK